MASLLILVVRVSVELAMAMTICRWAGMAGRRYRSRPRAAGRPRRELDGRKGVVHALIFASTVVNVHGVVCVIVRVVVICALAGARVGGRWGHEVVSCVVWVVDATSCDVRIWETNRSTSGMIPPMAAHIGVDVEFAPTARKRTTIWFCPRVGVYVNFHATRAVETFSAVRSLVLLSPAF